jgi:hypothetical protein
VALSVTAITNRRYTYEMKQLEIIFQDTVTETGNGSDITVNGYYTLNIFISGTSTSRTITFKGLDQDENIYDLIGYKIGDTEYTGAITTNGNSESWIFSDIQNFKYIRFPISAISGGNCTIKGIMT